MSFACQSMTIAMTMFGLSSITDKRRMLARLTTTDPRRSDEMVIPKGSGQLFKTATG